MPRPIRHSLQAAALAALIVLATGGVSPSEAQDVTSTSSRCNGTVPCFTGVSDILGGRRMLLPNDDLIVSVQNPSTSTSTSTFASYYLYTSDLMAPADKSGVTFSNSDCTGPNQDSGAPFPVFTRAGRVFDLKGDVSVVYAPVPKSSSTECLDFVMNLNVYSLTDEMNAIASAEVEGFTAAGARLLLADADRDGYDDILVIDASGMGWWGTNPKVTKDAELSPVGPGTKFFPSRDLEARNDPVAGDFNGDGAIDIAWVGAASGGPIQVHFASVCPAAGWTVLGQTCSGAFDTFLAPEPLVVDDTAVWNNSAGLYPIWFVEAGNFINDTNPDTGIIDDELVVGFKFLGEVGTDAYGEIVLAAYDDFDDMLEPDLNKRTIKSIPGPQKWGSDTRQYTLTPYLFAASGRLDWQSGTDQLVTATSDSYFQPTSGASGTVVGVTIVTFADDDLSMTTHPHYAVRDTNVLYRGVAVGRFDPADLSNGDTDFDGQIATLMTEGAADDSFVVITAVDPSTLATTTASVNPYGRTLVSASAWTAPLQVGDLQGRSLRLGPPEKATVVHTQADIVLGMPPMHVDFVRADEGDNPSVVNVSVAPAHFNLAYTESADKNVKQSRKSTTSYTYTTKESGSEGISYGVPGIGSVSVKAKQAATQTHKSTVKNTYDTYTDSETKLSTATVFDDVVLSTTQRMNIYTYPVIGGVCPAASPNCPNDCGSGPSPCPRIPMSVQFSGADNVNHNPPTPAGGLEWYQPVNQPGNLFSYPGSLAQLKADQPQEQATNGGMTSRYQQLADGDTGPWQITGSDTTQSVNWTSNSTSGSTAGSTSNHSFNASVSASGSVGIGGFGLKASAKFDYKNSTSIKTLNSLTIKLSQSDGVTLVTDLGSSTLPKPVKNYAFGSYIFGLKAPTGLIQDDIDLDSDVPGQGPLRVGSVADPLAMGSADWWQDTYKEFPDVALNHPKRWSQAEPQGTTVEQVWFNCPVGYSSSATSPACSRARRPRNLPIAIAENPFYQMKGFFVHQGALESLDSPGPTTTSATFGDEMLLRARIYNASLADMPAGTKVHAAFYAQPWSDGQFLSQTGNEDAFAPAVFIGEDTLDPIPPFCGGIETGQDPCKSRDAPRNWVFANVVLDTTKLGQPTAGGASYWKFWVVTWIESGTGLVSELAEHGLKEAPGADLNSLADVAIETYSNNLGFYNQVFSLLPPIGDAAESGAALAAIEAPEASIEPVLRIEKIHVPRKRRLRGTPSTVRATLRANVPVRDLMVSFFDGDPDEGGAPFDVEMIPFIAADEPFVVPVPYRPSSCEAKHVHVEAIAVGGSVEPASTRTYRRIRPDIGCRKRHRRHDRHRSRDDFGKHGERQQTAAAP